MRSALSLRAIGLSCLLALCAALPAQSRATQRFSGERALNYTREFVTASGRRWVGSEGHAKAEGYIRKQFAHDALEADDFTASTPVGILPMRNFIVKFPGKKDGLIVVATHYETNYPLRNIDFVGANDGGATTGLLVELANHLRGHPLEGYSVWLVFFDGEEAFQQWSDSDSTYGSRHLAAKWSADGTLRKIKAFLLTDMIGDRDLNIQRETNSTPWVLDVVKSAAKNIGDQRYLFAQEGPVSDDHLPFVKRGVPVADIIDIDYGPHDRDHPDGWHHTAEDTLDKLSAHSLQVAGDIVMETIRLLNQR
jgi:Zn-dependent M28 family amino/carboxypeptidase